MTDNVLYFKLKLAAPLHVGTGDVYEPVNFVLDPQQKKMICFEPADFLAQLSSAELDHYSAICLKGSIESIQELYKFMRLHYRLATGQEIDISPDFLKQYNDTLEKTPQMFKKEVNKFQISCTAFNRWDNQPIIPGSAIKGAIRTAVLNHRNPDSSHLKFGGRDGNRQLQQHLLEYSTIETDPFRLVKVSDFISVGQAKRKIVYAVDRKKKLSLKESQAPYQILEVVERETEFWGSISVLSAPGSIKKPVSLAEVEASLREFYGGEKKREDLELTAIKVRPAQMEDDKQQIPIRVGRHSGAECITVSGRRQIKIMQKRGTSPLYKDHATTIWLASPTPRPKTTKDMEPMGWATLSLLSRPELSKIQLRKKELHDSLEKDRQDKIAEQAAQQAAFEEQQRIVEEEKRRLQEEAEQYPWRGLLPGIETIADWGQLKQKALENEKLCKFQKNQEVGEAVFTAAKRVRKSTRKNWTEERDRLVEQWLEKSNIQWHRAEVEKKGPKQSPNLSPEERTAVETIQEISDWGAFTQSKLDLQSLPMLALQVLLSKMKDKNGWNCGAKKAKKDKKQALKSVQKLLRK